MLTRHLYRVDEVRAALMWCILKRRVCETAFWATELEEAGCDFTDELVSVWTLGIGVAGLGFLGHLEQTSRATAIALSCWQPRDATVVAVLGSSPDRVGSPDIPPGPWTPEEVYALRAMMQGKAGSAFAATWPWSLWATAMDFKHGQTLDVTNKALAVAIVCQPIITIRPFSTEIPTEVQEAMDEWAAETNLRKRRVYAIPKECLNHLTARGALDCYTTTDGELRDLRRFEKVLAKSPLWSEAIALAKTSDDEYESFYDSYLCDLPCEWSLEDRAKSHGTGVNPCDIHRLLQRWFGTMPCTIWKGVQRANFDPKTLPPLAPVKRILHVL